MNINPRIVIASCLGLFFVFGAFVLSSDETYAEPDPRLTAVTGPAPEREYIPVQDTDGDGTADWKKLLPRATNWLTASTTGTTTAATSTHTELFAKQTLEQLMNAGIYGAYGNNTDTILAYSNEFINKLAVDELYTESDIIVSQNTSETALRAYGNRVAGITIENSVDREIESELSILNQATQTQDPESLADLMIIAAAYEQIVYDMLATQVPYTYTKEHLDLINTYNAILVDIRAMQQVFTDPLYALVRVKRYEEDGKGLFQAVTNLYVKLHQDGIRWGEHDTASKFIRVNL